MPFTLAQLEYAVAVDTHRNFGKAAAACHVSQPTLSMQVQKLERHLGVELFDRTKQPVEPTDVGHQLLHQARVVLREAERMRELVRESDGEVVGELRVGIIPTVSSYLLPRFLPRLAAGYPKLKLKIEELRTRPLVEQLQGHRLDVGIVATAIERADLVEVPLFEEPFVGYVSERDPGDGAGELSLAALRLDELWLLNEGHCFRDQVVELCREKQRAIGGQRQVRFESGNLETLKRMVETSGGMTLLPALATLDLRAEEARRLRRFREPAPYRVVRMVSARSYLKRKAIAALQEEIRRSLADAPGGVRVLGEGTG